MTVDAGNRGAEGFGSEDRGAQSLETFTATDGHPFLVVSGERLDLRGDAEHVPLYEPLGTPRGRWVRAAELLPGDTVATRSGFATVVRVAPHAQPEVVYNLHVEGTSRYLVGACGVVVHNSPGGEAAAKTLAANRAAGKAAERQAARDLLEEGNEILGTQVTVQTSQGRRVVDHLIRIPEGQIMAVEVKSGGAVRTATQRAKDGAMGIWGIPVGKNAPARLRGRTLSIPTIERRY